MMKPKLVPDRPFTWAQAESSGLSRARLNALLHEGTVRRVLNGVHQPADLEDTRCSTGLRPRLLS